MHKKANSPQDDWGQFEVGSGDVDAIAVAPAREEGLTASACSLGCIYKNTLLSL